MEEIWKDVENHKNYYKVSSFGQLYSFPRRGTKGGYTYGIKNDKGYLCARLIKNGEQTDKKMHILVYETFVGTIPKGYDVHHKNHNKEDNRVENLELIPHSEHSKEHFKDKRDKVLKSLVNSRSIPVIQFTLDGKFIAEYPSASEAARQNGLCGSDITACCRKRMGVDKDGYKYTHRTAGGFIWKYKNDEELDAA